ncbi:hypothetical protein, partial [Pediococcus acidilactici]|uniref:hypothetical protein n=1 Tax=Pediococcus acidilactici TaxID=1254 RepID=UPI002E18801B
RKIKQINRTAYGYRNWQHLRDRVFIEFSLKTKKGNQFVAKRNDFLNSFYPHLLTDSPFSFRS